MLWGDHGFHLGDLGIWTKHTNYEQANRIPILIAAPGVTRPNTSTNQLAESVDIFPTLAELAGLPAPGGPQPIDGKSLVPVLEDPGARVRDHAYHVYPRKRLGRAIRTERYRLVDWGDDAIELYDYENDPLERENHAAKERHIVAELKQILARYPEPVDRDGRREQGAGRIETPQIAYREIRIPALVEAESPYGVVLAQGGRENGYALHFIDGVPTLDVRLNGKVTRLSHTKKFSGNISILAVIGKEAIGLTVEGHAVSAKSPGLIPVQPKDGLSTGFDDLSAAGDYDAPNRFNGKVLHHQIITSQPDSTPSKRTGGENR